MAYEHCERPTWTAEIGTVLVFVNILAGCSPIGRQEVAVHVTECVYEQNDNQP